MGLKHYIEEHINEFTHEKLVEVSELLAKVVDNHVEDHIDKIKKKIAGIKNDYHFDEETANACIEKMYYDENGKKYAPYWNLEIVRQIYNSYKSKEPILATYNLYDFYVALNMIKSDNYKLYKKRFSGYTDSQLDNLFIEDTINWLDDKDNPYGEHKIWMYLNK